jgi:hypothetical protein
MGMNILCLQVPFDSIQNGWIMSARKQRNGKQDYLVSTLSTDLSKNDQL